MRARWQQVLAATKEADRAALCGPKGLPDAAKRAVRGGTTGSKVVLGGSHQYLPTAGARQRGRELYLPRFAWAACADPLNVAAIQE